MSFIDIEYDKLVLSTSPLLNTFYFPKKFYRLYQSTKTDDNIIINGSFLFNETNEKYLCNSPVAIKKNGINDFNFIEVQFLIEFIFLNSITNDELHIKYVLIKFIYWFIWIYIFFFKFIY